MIRSSLMVAVVTVFGLCLRAGYGYGGYDLALGFGILAFLGGVVSVVETWWGRVYTAYLIPAILGSVLGFLASFPCIQWLEHVSFLVPVLENFPWGLLLKMFFVFLGMLVTIFVSQEGFFVKALRPMWRPVTTRRFRLFRWLLRGAFLLIFLIVAFSSFKVEVRSLGVAGPSWISEMARLGYDFDLGPKNFVLSSPALWISFLILILSEWFWGDIFLKGLGVFLPAIGFTLAMSSLAIELFGGALARELPSDLAQAFLIVLCAYLGFSWCIRAVETQNYWLPFCKIEFNDRES